MTRGPRRLKDDPDFKWETGCDLADEELLHGGADLGAMKAALLARIGPAVSVGDGMPTVRPSPSAAASAVKPLVGAMVAAAVIVGAYWLGTQQGGVDVADDAAVRIVAPAVTPTAPMDEDEIRQDEAAPEAIVPSPESVPTTPDPTPDPTPETVDVLAAADGTDPEPPPTSAAAQPPAAGEPDETIAEDVDGTADASLPEPDDNADADADVGAASPTHEDASPATSEAGRALALYNAAQEHLVAGEVVAAREGFEAYLDAFPDRYMSAEARLGLLQTLFALGDAEGTAALAGELQELPALSAKRPEILRLRAESLLVLERCPEALTLVDALPTRDAAPIRRACRLQRREGSDGSEP